MAKAKQEEAIEIWESKTLLKNGQCLFGIGL